LTYQPLSFEQLSALGSESCSVDLSKWETHN
jgi:hypothetical protein